MCDLSRSVGEAMSEKICPLLMAACLYVDDVCPPPAAHCLGDVCAKYRHEHWECNCDWEADWSKVRRPEEDRCPHCGAERPWDAFSC